MISFIIPAHDEARLIGATLVSIQAAADALGLAYECIVVDDASGDATAAIAGAMGARVVRVEYRHIAATRNAGARAAHGQRLFFVDADTQVDVELVRAALQALDAGAVGGGCTVRLHGPLAWHERLAVAAAVAALRLARIAPGCFQFCTRAAFEATGGYDERWFAAEDIVDEPRPGPRRPVRAPAQCGAHLQPQAAHLQPARTRPPALALPAPRPRHAALTRSVGAVVREAPALTHGRTAREGERGRRGD
jgi:glycosyltransferase involved in cell wall biosynthesis